MSPSQRRLHLDQLNNQPSQSLDSTSELYDLCYNRRCLVYVYSADRSYKERLILSGIEFYNWWIKEEPIRECFDLTPHEITFLQTGIWDTTEQKFDENAVVNNSRILDILHHLVELKYEPILLGSYGLFMRNLIDRQPRTLTIALTSPEKFEKLYEYCRYKAVRRYEDHPYSEFVPEWLEYKEQGIDVSVLLTIEAIPCLTYKIQHSTEGVRREINKDFKINVASGLYMKQSKEQYINHLGDCLVGFLSENAYGEVALFSKHILKHVTDLGQISRAIKSMTYIDDIGNSIG